MSKTDRFPGIVTPVISGLREWWFDWVSPSALPWLRPAREEDERACRQRRDWFSLIMFFCAGAGVWGISWCSSKAGEDTGFSMAAGAITAVMLWRAVDLLLLLALSIAVFGGIRDYLWWQQASTTSLQRSMVFALMSYVELMLVYTVLYFALSWIRPGEFQVQPGEFQVRLTALDSFFLSTTTVTTIGFGQVAPSGWLGTVSVLVQAMNGLLFVAGVLAVTLNNIRRPGSLERCPRCCAKLEPEREGGDITWLNDEGERNGRLLVWWGVVAILVVVGALLPVFCGDGPRCAGECS